jgi:hypothetical protein
MVHWNNLSEGERALLTKLVEGSCYDPADDNLAKLLERGLIEPSADGWQATPAGRSAYVIRDHLREKNPARSGGSHADAS